MRWVARRQPGTSIGIHSHTVRFPATGQLLAMKQTQARSLYERIGGRDSVDAAVSLFYSKVLDDDLLAPFFDDVPMEEQMRKQRIFLAYAFGAPVTYGGKDLRQGHAHLVERGLDEVHFALVAGHLAMTLHELGLSQDLVSEVMEIAASTKDEVLGL